MTEPTSLLHTAASIVSPPSSTETDTGSRVTPTASGIDRLVVLGLPPGRVDALPEVAAAIEQADAYERHPELGGGLEMVARKDAEAAGIDRQALVQPELHAEVGDERARARHCRARAATRSLLRRSSPSKARAKLPVQTRGGVDRAAAPSGGCATIRR